MRQTLTHDLSGGPYYVATETGDGVKKSGHVRGGFASLFAVLQIKNQFFRLWKPFHNNKSWLFCWTELGAHQIGILQSLIVTCRLHGLSPYDYLVDVLQRVGQHPAADVAQLTPRHWETHFAANPLRSDLSKFTNTQ